MSDEKNEKFSEFLKNLQSLQYKLDNDTLTKEFCRIFGLDEEYITKGTVPVKAVLEEVCETLLDIFRRENGYQYLFGSFNDKESSFKFDIDLAYIPCSVFANSCGRNSDEKNLFIDFLKKVVGIFLSMTKMVAQEQNNTQMENLLKNLSFKDKN